MRDGVNVNTDLISYDAFEFSNIKGIYNMGRR